MHDTREPRPHTGRRRNEAARRAILDAALGLLADADGAPVTVETIARAAGVGRQTLYRWWPSKGAVLLDALLDRAAQDVPAPDTGNLRDDLRALVTATFEAAQRPPAGPALRTLVREAARDPRLAELLRTFTESRRAAVRAVLERGRERGELPAGQDVDLLVDQFYGLFWYRFLLGHAPLDRPAALRLTDALLGQALAERP
ncbi:TetR/AcrR family transcriptional regulator [Streptomyces misionensis]|uniref:TetR/AcrR family transcriptional regulator n=1 Tax=Streptomyces misionensis TaxID=67331 RepID=UPI0033B9D46D